MQPKFKVWVAFNDDTKFGDGRAKLLQTIDEFGSINKAVAQFGMSYRTAWGYIQELEEAAGRQLLDRAPGRGMSGGTRLTAEGRQFLRQYRQFRRGLDTMIAKRFAAAFGRRRKTAPRRRSPR